MTEQQMIDEYTHRFETAEAACRKAAENATLLIWAMDRGQTARAYDLAKEIRSTCKAVFGETVGES